MHANSGQKVNKIKNAEFTLDKRQKLCYIFRKCSDTEKRYEEFCKQNDDAAPHAHVLHVRLLLREFFPASFCVVIYRFNGLLTESPRAFRFLFLVN